MPTLSYADVKRLVATNNKATRFSNELVLCVCWKESNFKTDATPGIPGNTSTGLMQVNDVALQTVNDNTPNGVHFEHADMIDGAKAVAAGTYYLQIILDKFDGVDSVADALDTFKGDASKKYHANLLAAEPLLKAAANDDDAMVVLRTIHP